MQCCKAHQWPEAQQHACLAAPVELLAFSMLHEVKDCTLIGGCGVDGGGGISSVLRIQKGNSFTTLVPYDLDTVTLSIYLQMAEQHLFVG